ncbi:MAG: hypothetical protein FGM16_08700 [Flavobacterium sp.]|nr:hypothetical protein [Flavobacterium sp.]
MKKLICLVLFLVAQLGQAQEHFAGVSTSKRVGIVNLTVNPSELANLKNHFEIQLLSSSMNVANNKVGFNDLTDDTNTEDLLLSGTKPINFNFSNEILGPGVAVRLLKWRFAVTSKVNIKAGVLNVSPVLASYLTGSDVQQLPIGGDEINYFSNQRFNGTMWGEVGFAVARKVWENEKGLLNAGINVKLMFPGAYANMGIGNFNGTVTNNNDGDLVLKDTDANVNFAYSGSLAQEFTNSKQYTNSLFGNFDGLAADIGVDYQLKKGNSYKLKVGASIMNLGGMTYNDNNNNSTDYKLKISGNQELVLNFFDGVDDIPAIKQHLIDEAALGNIEFTEITSNKDFRVSLPTTLNLYADVHLISKLNVTLFTQQKLNSNSGNNQIAAQTIYSVTPRFGIGFFEAYLPVSVNDISGTNAGLGFRLGGFFMGSNSILSSISSNAKQADFNFGFRFAIL